MENNNEKYDDDYDRAFEDWDFKFLTWKEIAISIIIFMFFLAIIGFVIWVFLTNR